MHLYDRLDGYVSKKITLYNKQSCNSNNTPTKSKLTTYSLIISKWSLDRYSLTYHSSQIVLAPKTCLGCALVTEWPCFQATCTETMLASFVVYVKKPYSQVFIYWLLTTFCKAINSCMDGGNSLEQCELKKAFMPKHFCSQL